MDEPETYEQILMTASLEEFLTPEAAEAEEKAKREERVAAQERYYSETEEGKRRARMKQEEAEIGGALTPVAELFRDMRLKPRIKEAHAYEPVVRTPVVQGLFFKDSLTWVAGESGTFKSFVTADLAFRYGSDDMDYHGKRMTHGRVLLIIAEGAGGYADRKTAWEHHHEREVKNVSIYPAPLQLGDTLKEMPALLSYLREEDEAGHPFDLIIFDTQAMCTVGVDENTSEMNLVVNVLHRIREISGACVMVVHHFGKQKSAGMRGSSMIYAAADTVCVLKRKEDSTAVHLSTSQADGGKQKDAITEKDLLQFDMQSHPVGEDYFGDAIYSLVPVALEQTGRPMTDAEIAEEDWLPSVTDTQLYYLRGINTYEDDGALPSYLRERMDDPEYSERLGRRPKGHKMTRTTPGNQMQDLKKKGLTEPVPGKKGAWRITPKGVAVVIRTLTDAERTEENWTRRAGSRRPVQGPVQGQSELDE